MTSLKAYSAPTYLASIKATLKYSPLNGLLFFIPAALISQYTNQSATLTFIFSALSIIPLAALLSFGTEQIALGTSQCFGGLLNGTLGNLIEVIIAGIALKNCELEMVQSSLLGGLLNNLLLVLGMAFVVGGYRFHQQEFQPAVAQLNSSLLTVSVIALIIPAAFHGYLERQLKPETEVERLLRLSRSSAIVLLLIYFGYLAFQFYSHNHLFIDTSSLSSKTTYQRIPMDTPPLCSSPPPTYENEGLRTNIPFTLVLMMAVTVLAYITSEILVNSISGLVADHPGIVKEWITLIIIPIISNAAEHTTTVVVASKGKFDLAISVAVGSCIQISLFVIPVLVMMAWAMGKPLSLLFDPLETLALFFSVLLVKFSMEDGKSHWMSGLILIGAYSLISLAFWNFPATTHGQPFTCVP
ncbi:Sodium/calcium exchanger protein-domain-containing protein [Amanita rubescens]|nr:Sodium/calcium exchanger protein-domain-containing protein [Amanita rubescens]